MITIMQKLKMIFSFPEGRKEGRKDAPVPEPVDDKLDHCSHVLSTCLQPYLSVDVLTARPLSADWTADQPHTEQPLTEIIIIKLYCHIQRALHDELECSLALTHIVPIYIYIYNKMKYGK